jgi:hypothetical protein
MKLGIVVTSPRNIREVTISAKIQFFPGKLCFARAYAHIEDRMICPAVPTTVMKTVLKI